MLGRSLRGGLLAAALLALLAACAEDGSTEPAGEGAAPPADEGGTGGSTSEAVDELAIDDGDPEGEAMAPRRGLGTVTGRVPGHPATVGGIRLVSHRVRAVVQGGFARTEIEEVFANDTSRVLEGRFVFPLPPGATVTRLGLWVGDTLVEGEIVERGRASRIFRGIVEDTVRPRDPALLEWVRGGEVSMTIFPIPARGSRKVILAYDEVLEPRDGRARYVHALSLGAERAATIDDFSVSVRVVGARGEAITTPGWSAHVGGDGARTDVEFAATRFAPERDFVVELGREAEEPFARVAMSAPEPAFGGSAPPRVFATRVPVAVPEGVAGRRAPSARVLVLDTSESQSEETLRAQRRLVTAAVNALGDDAQVAVLACDSACSAYPASGLVRAGDLDGDALGAFVAALRPRGASDLAGAIVTAARRLETGGQVVLLHDGQASAGEIAPDRIGDRIAPVLEVQRVDLRLIGVGRTVDDLALSGLARAVGAAFEPLAGPGALGERVASLVDGLDRPVLADAVLQMPPGYDDIVPAVLPSVRLGDALTVLGTASHADERGDEGGAMARLTGTVDGEPVELTIPLVVERDGTPNPLLPKLWADRTIAAIDAEGGTNAKRRIVELSTAFHVMSRHTSLLVLENERMFAEFGVARTTLRASDQADHAFGGGEGLGVGEPLGSGSGLGQGFGGGDGRLGGSHRTKAPQLRMGHTMVSGRLPPEAVQRVVRMQMGRFRACYERGLMKNPALAGRVTTRFVIGRTGQVTSTGDGGSDLPDREVVACVVSNFAALQFPQPEGGIITVTYPIVFSSDGTRPMAPAALWPIPNEPIRPFVPRAEPPRPAVPWQPPYTLVVTHSAGDDRWRGERGEALAKLGEAARGAPESRARRERWIRALLVQGHFQEAHRAARAFVEVDPDLALGRELLAMAAAAAGDGADALAAVEALAEADARGLDAHVRAARALEGSGDHDRACAHRRTVAELRPLPADVALAEACWARLEGRAAVTPARDAAKGAFVATVTCADPGLACPDVAVVTPTGRVVSRAAPFGAETVTGGIALGTVGAGTYRTVLVGGDPAARGKVHIRAHGSAREVPFEPASARTALRTTVEQRWRPRIMY